MTQHQLPSLQQQHVQQQQRRRPDEGRGRDFWDTDTGSIDSTANQSVVRTKIDSQMNQQHMQPDEEEYDTNDDEQVSGDNESEATEQYAFDDDLKSYLAGNGLADAPYHTQIDFLQRTQPHVFPTVDGDSYPTTTDGNPTEWDEQQGQHVEDPGSPPASPLPQRHPQQDLNTPFQDQQPRQRNQTPNLPSANVDPQGSTIWVQGAQIRGQQRTEDQVHTHEQTHIITQLQSSQPPTYSQATVEPTVPLPSAMHVPSNVITGDDQGSLPQRASRVLPGAERASILVSGIIQPAATFQNAATRQVQPEAHHQAPAEPGSIEGPPVLISGDYESDVLFKMGYDQLRDESFDTDPQAPDFLLPNDVHNRPLSDRLEFTRRLEAPAQAEFFAALPTNEWEDAGDWFVEQFTAIIKKTKDARQKKRASAQSFEKEIEERHQHVAKKQRVVESAMKKMQARGEGLVPKSPKPSRSPRPQRG